jgi:integrase
MPCCLIVGLASGPARVLIRTLARLRLTRSNSRPIWPRLRHVVEETDPEEKPVLVAKYGFHVLRHAAASLFIQYLKWSPKRLQTVMGHSSVRMTFDRYGHLFDDIEVDRADMAKIEAAVRAA